jgi:hypothetical protein
MVAIISSPVSSVNLNTTIPSYKNVSEKSTEKLSSNDNSKIAKDGVQFACELFGLDFQMEAAGVAVDVVENVHNIGTITADFIAKYRKIIDKALKVLIPFSSGMFGLYYGNKGIKGLENYIKDKNTMKLVEAIDDLAVSAQCNLHFAASVSKHIGPQALSSLLNSPLSLGIMSGLGIFYGGLDAVLGLSLIHEGMKSRDEKKLLEGVLDTGIGLAGITFYAGGGIPAVAVMGVLFLAKLLNRAYNEYKNRKDQDLPKFPSMQTKVDCSNTICNPSVYVLP